jgi:hypothetical protein
MADLTSFVFDSTLHAGMAGGFVLFLAGYKDGHYHNNKYLIKCSTEVLGGGITAYYVSSLALDSFSSFNPNLIPFIIGVSWTAFIQLSRSFVTNKVRQELNDGDNQ